MIHTISVSINLVYNNDNDDSNDHIDNNNDNDNSDDASNTSDDQIVLQFARRTATARGAAKARTRPSCGASSWTRPKRGHLAWLLLLCLIAVAKCTIIITIDLIICNLILLFVLWWWWWLLLLFVFFFLLLLIILLLMDQALGLLRGIFAGEELRNIRILF